MIQSPCLPRLYYLLDLMIHARENLQCNASWQVLRSILRLFTHIVLRHKSKTKGKASDLETFCRCIEENFPALNTLYRRLEGNLRRKVYKNTDDEHKADLVSATALSEGLLREFCVVRLLELCRQGVNNSDAQRLVRREVKNAEGTD